MNKRLLFGGRHAFLFGNKGHLRNYVRVGVGVCVTLGAEEKALRIPCQEILFPDRLAILDMKNFELSIPFHRNLRKISSSSISFIEI